MWFRVHTLSCHRCRGYFVALNYALQTFEDFEREATDPLHSVCVNHVLVN